MYKFNENTEMIEFKIHIRNQVDESMNFIVEESNS